MRINRRRTAVSLGASFPLLIAAILLARWGIASWQERAFFGAAERGDVVAVQTALDRGINVNTVRSYTEGWTRGEPLRVTETALELAAAEGQLEVVRLLLDHGADPNIRCTFNATALTSAAMRSGQAEIIRLLIDAGADLTVVGGNPAFPSSALGWAVGRSDYETFRVLLRASLDQRCFKTLQPGALSELQWRSPHSMNRRFAKGLTAEYPEGTILWAAMQGDSTSLQQLVSEAGDVSRVGDADGWTPLHWSSGIEGSLTDVQVLLAHSTDPNVATVHGYTPLMAAAEAGDTEKIRLLLQAGADVSLTDEDGDTALHAACQYAPIEAVSLLVKAGADGRVHANDQVRPLDIARERARMGGTDVTDLVKGR